MPPTYFFVIDVTSPAMIAKSVEAIAATIRDVLDQLPGGERTRGGFLTFDAHLQFWCLKSGSAQPQMMVSWLAWFCIPFSPLQRCLGLYLRHLQVMAASTTELCPSAISSKQPCTEPATLILILRSWAAAALSDPGLPVRVRCSTFDAQLCSMGGADACIFLPRGWLEAVMFRKSCHRTRASSCHRPTHCTACPGTDGRPAQTTLGATLMRQHSVRTFDPLQMRHATLAIMVTVIKAREVPIWHCRSALADVVCPSLVCHTVRLFGHLSH